jgi:hypothetical protein
MVTSQRYGGEMIKVKLENYDDDWYIASHVDAELLEGYQLFLHHPTRQLCIYLDIPNAYAQHICHLHYLLPLMKGLIPSMPVHHIDDNTIDPLHNCFFIEQHELWEYLDRYARKKTITSNTIEE